MKRLRWQLLVVVLALVAIAVLLFGQQPELLPGGSDPVVEPVQGGVYTEALIGAMGRLNPVLDYYNQADRDIDRLIYSSLVSFDHRGLPFGDLADAWGISRDGMAYSFSVRPDAFWHDGEPVTSYDIIFTIEIMRSGEIPIPADIQDFWSQVDVDFLDEKTVRFQLPEPFAPFLDYLTFGVLPEHLLGSLAPEEIIDASFNLNPIGSGPYKFNSFNVEDGEVAGVVLDAFDRFYGQKPYIDTIVMDYYPTAIGALFAYKEGDVMGISEVNSEILSDVLVEPNLQMFTGRMPRFNLIYLNLDLPEKPFLQDPIVRRALLKGINRQQIINRIFGGQAVMAHGPVFPESWAYYDGIEKLDFDPDAAIKMLKEAGYTIPAEGGSVRANEGVFLTLEMIYPDTAPYDLIAASIQSDWGRLGVRVDLIALPYGEMLDNYLEPRVYEVALAEINLDRAPDPDPYPFWHQTQINGGQNYSGWDDRQASEYLERARVIVEIDERSRLYRNFQFRFSQELPALPLFYPVYSYSVDQQILGVNMGPIFDPSDRYNNISTWFIFSGVPESEPVASEN